MSKGWYGNSYGHYLASKGISVKQLKDIHHFPETIDYEDPEEFISAFWIASLKNDFSDFDFKKVFQITRSELYSRMNRYAYLSFEDFINDYNVPFNVLELAGRYIDEYDWFEEKYVDEYDKQNVSVEMTLDVYNLANKERKESWAGIDPIYDKLFEVYNEMEELPVTLQDKIILMDKLVDLQHHRGSIWTENEYHEFIDIDDLREDFEKKFKLERFR